MDRAIDATSSAQLGAVQSRRAVALGGPADVASGLEFVRESSTTGSRRSGGFEPRARSEVVDRGVNLTLASVATLLVAPVMLMVALAVMLTSPGPVMYTQTRVGRDRRRPGGRPGSDRRRANSGGELFTIFKFRSMRTDAETGGTAVWAVQNDPRVTPIGNFLRRSRLDELPQLLNVIKGDMNIVGPRPERPQIFNELAGQIPEYSLRALAKPGITGLAQINHTYDTCIESVRVKVRYDLEYLQSASVWTDLRIMAMTIPVMLLRKGGW
ncbi:MAG: sugar transferase [Gemmatimonadetes bacterium]|nr:sugar transferase [Gemmatimonadota bacterium]